MRIKYIYQILSAILFVFFVGCTKEIKEEQLGNLNGRVMVLSNQLYTLSALKNTTVKLQAGDYNVEATTDSTGLFEFNDIPIGTYNLIYTNEGYSTFIDYGVQVFGGVIPIQLNPIRLYELSHDEIVMEDIETRGSMNSYNSYLEIFINYKKTEEKATTCLLLLSRSDNVDLHHYEYAYFYSTYRNSGSIYIQSDYERFPVNSQWNIKLYPVSNEDYYLDPETGKEVYYTANPEVSTKASFTVLEPEEY